MTKEQQIALLRDEQKQNDAKLTFKRQLFLSLFAKDLESNPALLTQSQVGRIMDVTPASINGWLRKGKLFIFKGNNNRKMISREDALLQPYYIDSLIDRVNLVTDKLFTNEK